jgi:hypothetical protein
MLDSFLAALMVDNGILNVKIETLSFETSGKLTAKTSSGERRSSTTTPSRVIFVLACKISKTP